MTTYSARDVIKAAQDLSQEMVAEIKEMVRLRQENTVALQETSEKRDAVGREIAQALLPALTPEHLANLLRILPGNPFAGGPDLISARETERQSCSTFLHTTATDSRYVQRERLLSDLERQCGEASRGCAAEKELTARARHPRLEHLLAVNYGTPDYTVGWWRPGYYDDWKAGDEILERFPGQEDFRPFRALLLAARKTVAEANGRIAEWQREIRAIEDLSRSVEHHRRTLAQLDEVYLKRAQDAVCVFLREGDEASIAQCLAGDARVCDAFRILRGMEAKVRYLLQIDGQIQACLDQSQEIRTKADRDVAKWGRPKRSAETLEEADYEKRYVMPGRRFRRRREHFSGMSSSLLSYQDYDRYDPSSDMLWWDLFTNGRYDGGFIPEVASRQQTHPDYRYRPSLDDSQAAAIEAGLLQRPDGNHSLVDPS
jgi:hypothetical protein